MKISELFDSKKKESQRLADELETHMLRWPEIKAEFDRCDVEQCIPAAHSYQCAVVAMSPTVYKLEAQLRVAREKRDNLKRRFQTRRDELHRALAKINQPAIAEFGEYGMRKLRNLTELFTPEKLDSFRDLADDRRTRYTVRIEHNGKALRLCRDRILALRAQVMLMLYLPLAEIEKKIAAAKTEISIFDLSPTEIEEVGEGRASELLRPPEASVSAGVMFLDGPGCRTFMKNPDLAGPRLKNLESKISALEGRSL